MIDELPFKSSLPELGKIIDGVVKAGEKVLEIYETDFSTEKKDDDSPITQADIESNKILKEVLGKTGITICLLYTSPSPRDATLSRMPSSA